MGFCEKYGKRALDIICSLLATVCFWQVYVVIGIIVHIEVGSQVIFKQPRPQLVRKMGFIDEKRRKRYAVRLGLRGLAWVDGSNAITWDEKLEWDFKCREVRLS